MKVRWEDYQNVLKGKEYIFSNVWGDPSMDRCSHMAVATGAHIIACVDFYGHTFGYTPEVNASLEKLRKFYNIT